MNIKSLFSIKILFFFTLIFSAVALFAQTNNRYELESIDFKGNDNISSSELETIIPFTETPNWFLQFINSFTSYGEGPAYFDSLLIPTAIENLKSFYSENGYFEAKVNAEYELNKNDNEAKLTFNIDEGEASTFRNLRLQGVAGVLPEYQKNINEMTKVDTNRVYSAQFVIQKREQIINYLRNNGYMFADKQTPNVYVLVDTMKNEVKVELTLEPGDRYRIDEIRVDKMGKGKNLVSDKLIKEIVNIEPGAVYNYYDIQRAEIRLYRTNLFSSALVSGVIPDTSNDRVPLNISADVGLLNEVVPELILNDQDGALNTGLGVSYTRKNFLGDARKISISSSIASQDISNLLRNVSLQDTTVYGYADARLTIEQPFLFNKPINTQLEPFITLQKRKEEYNATIYGARLSFNFELPPSVFLTSLTTYLNWENSRYLYQENYIRDQLISYYKDTQQNLTDEEVRAQTEQTLDELGGDNSIRTTNANIGFDFLINKTNDFLFPTQGYNIALLLEDGNTIPFLISEIGSYNFNSPIYYKVFLNSTAYLPIYAEKTSALGLKFQTGYIHAYSGNKFSIPSNQRFYSGGSNSVRGWGARELVPQAKNINLEGVSNQDLLRGVSPGGFFILEGSIETRNRIIGNIGGALFVDYGNTWNSLEEFQFKTVAIAAGFGLRYYSDFAPIRIDFGFKIYDPDNQKTIFENQNVFKLNLGIGEAF